MYAFRKNAVKIRNFETKQFDVIKGKADKFFVHVMWYCVCVLVICVLVLTVPCIVCTVFLYCFVYVCLFLFVLSVLV